MEVRRVRRSVFPVPDIDARDDGGALGARVLPLGRRGLRQKVRSFAPLPVLDPAVREVCTVVLGILLFMWVLNALGAFHASSGQMQYFSLQFFRWYQCSAMLFTWTDKVREPRERAPCAMFLRP